MRSPRCSSSHPSSDTGAVGFVDDLAGSNGIKVLGRTADTPAACEDHGAYRCDRRDHVARPREHQPARPRADRGRHPRRALVRAARHRRQPSHHAAPRPLPGRLRRARAAQRLAFTRQALLRPRDGLGCARPRRADHLLLRPCHQARQPGSGRVQAGSALAATDVASRCSRCARWSSTPRPSSTPSPTSTRPTAPSSR